MQHMIQDIELYYEVTGHGADVLLLHGWGSSLRMWDALVDDLHRHYRCWSVDLAGFGGSTTRDDAVLNIAGHTAALVAFCDRHGICPRAVVGHSMGGLLTLRLALARPDLMQRLVLVCPVVTGRYAFNASVLLTTPGVRFLLNASKPIWQWVQSDGVAPLLPMSPYVPRAAQARVVRDFQRMNWAAGARALEDIPRADVGPLLHTIQHPALVVVGARDYTVPPDEGRLAAGALPNGRLIEYRDTHHQPLDEHPARFIAHLRDFLA